MIRNTNLPLSWRVAGLSTVALVALTGCGGSSSGTGTTNAAASPGSAAASGAGASGQILPVTTNPIKNSATAPTLKIASLLVENNVDPATGKPASDHLEIALLNTGSTPLTGLEVYYTIVDTKTAAKESYYTKLPSSFALAPGAKRVVNFDTKTGPDYFPVSKFSLYYQSKNALKVTAEVSATGAAPQTATADRAAGGPETVD